MVREPRGAAALRIEKTRAITQAVLELLGERGWAGLTMDAVASQAGVGKPALYRRWQSKDAMILECIEALAGATAQLPDSGTLRSDLLSLAEQSVAAMRDPIAGPVISAVISETHQRPDLAELVNERVRAPHRIATLKAFDRAVRRGDIGPDADLEIASDLLAAPFYMFAIELERTVPAEYAERLVDAILHVIVACPSPDHAGD